MQRNLILMGMLQASANAEGEGGIGEAELWVFDANYLPPGGSLSLSNSTTLNNSGADDYRWTIPTEQVIPDLDVWVFMAWNAANANVGSDVYSGYLTMTDARGDDFDVGEFNATGNGHYSLRGTGQFIHPGRSDPSDDNLAFGVTKNRNVYWLFNPHSGDHYMGAKLGSGGTGPITWFGGGSLRTPITDVNGDPTNILADITEASPFVSRGNMAGRRLAAQARDSLDRITILQRPIDFSSSDKPGGAIFLSELPTGPKYGDNGTGDGPEGDAVSMDVNKVYVVTQKYQTDKVHVRGQKVYAIIEE